MSCVSKVILTVESVQHYKSTDLLEVELVRIFDRYTYRYASICTDRNTTYRARSIDFSSRNHRSHRNRRTVATVAPSHRNVAPRASGRTGTFDLHGVWARHHCLLTARFDSSQDYLKHYEPSVVFMLAPRFIINTTFPIFCTISGSMLVLLSLLTCDVVIE